MCSITGAKLLRQNRKTQETILSLIKDIESIKTFINAQDANAAKSYYVSKKLRYMRNMI